MRGQVLERIFDGHNVVMLFFVDDVDDCGLSGALTGPRWASDEHQTIPEIRNLFEMLRQAEVFERGNLGGDNSHNDGIDASLLKDIYTEAGS